MKNLPPHTSEPWRLHIIHDTRIVDNEGNAIAATATVGSINELNNNNAKRIVACVNALEGYDTESLSSPYSANISIQSAMQSLLKVAGLDSTDIDLNGSPFAAMKALDQRFRELQRSNTWDMGSEDDDSPPSISMQDSLSEMYELSDLHLVGVTEDQFLHNMRFVTPGELDQIMSDYDDSQYNSEVLKAAYKQKAGSLEANSSAEQENEPLSTDELEFFFKYAELQGIGVQEWEYEIVMKHVTAEDFKYALRDYASSEGTFRTLRSYYRTWFDRVQDWTK